MTKLYDLSRLRDRVCALEDELHDLGASKIDGHEVIEIRRAANKALVQVETLKCEIEDRIGPARNYVDA